MHPAHGHLHANDETPEQTIARRVEVARQSGVPEAPLRRWAEQRRAMGNGHLGRAGGRPRPRARRDGLERPRRVAGRRDARATRPRTCACYQPGRRLLLSGDHLLGRVSLYFDEGHTPDPVGEFLGGLDRVDALDARLALAGHGRPFTDVAGHVAANRSLVAERLDGVRAALAERGGTAYELAQRVYGDAFSEASATWLLAKTRSWLTHLERRGEARRSPAEPGGDVERRWGAARCRAPRLRRALRRPADRCRAARLMARCVLDGTVTPPVSPPPHPAAVDVPGGAPRIAGCGSTSASRDGGPSFSFEFFPPKTEDGERNLAAALDELSGMDPTFVSVTYGAGGTVSQRDEDDRHRRGHQGRLRAGGDGALHLRQRHHRGAARDAGPHARRGDRQRARAARRPAAGRDGVDGDRRRAALLARADRADPRRATPSSRSAPRASPRSTSTPSRPSRTCATSRRRSTRARAS